MQTMLFMVRSLLRHVFVYVLHFSGTLARAKNQIKSLNATVVLTFHRVLPDEARSRTLSPASMVVSESTFAGLIEYLSSEHQVVSLKNHQKSSDSRKISLLVTFDDGWSDNAVYAAPILRRNGTPATIFLCPEKMGQVLPFWPERLSLYFSAATRTKRGKELVEMIGDGLSNNCSLVQVIEAVKSFPPPRRNSTLNRLAHAFSPETSTTPNHVDSTMDWDVARNLLNSEITFGSHTLHHEILTRIPLDMADPEVKESRERISREIGQACFSFAYPNGDWSPEVRDKIASAGYTLAFANSPGLWSKETDQFTIPRINLWEGAVIGPSGRFSKAHFDYVVFWRALRAAKC